MTRPLSNNLRERVVAAVAGGESCRSVAERFEVAVSSVVKWSQRYRATGSFAPGKMGGHRKRLLAPHRAFILKRLIPLRRPGSVDHASVGPRERADRGDLRIRQFEIENLEILRQPLHPARARDNDDARDNDALLHQIAQADLCRTLPMRAADAREHLVARRRTARDRAIGGHGDSVTVAGGNQFCLIEIGMQFELIGDDRLACASHSLVEKFHGKIRHADMSRQPFALDLCTAPPSFRR
jgi:transposase